jgi:hypothetical protein
MISIATTVSQMTRMSLLDVLWQLPAAVAYQVNLLHWQRDGNVFLVDDREEIRAALCQSQPK